MNKYVRTYVIDPQIPSVYERELTSDQIFDLCGGPVEVIGLRAHTDDSHALELSVGSPEEYHPDHWFEMDGNRYIGTAVVMAYNADGIAVDIDVSVKWVQDRVRFSE